LENENIKSYSEKNLFNKIKIIGKKAGIKVIYAVLLLFYAMKKTTTPKWAKRVIMGALGYFVLPIDSIPDFIPALGLTDDFGAIVVALGTVAMFIDNEVKQKAREKLKDWFGSYDENQLEEIESKVN
jgi:uncharacterized membrane protein YkvA (DUF1232 family)